MSSTIPADGVTAFSSQHMVCIHAVDGVQHMPCSATSTVLIVSVKVIARCIAAHAECYESLEDSLLGHS